MAKIFNGIISFASAIKPTGAHPLDDRSVVQSFSDLLADETFGESKYNGMLVAVLDDEQVYMLVDKDNSNDKNAWIKIGIENNTIIVENITNSSIHLTQENIGRLIYITGEESVYVISKDLKLIKLSSSNTENTITQIIINGVTSTLSGSTAVIDITTLDIPIGFDASVNDTIVYTKDTTLSTTLQDIIPNIYYMYYDGDDEEPKEYEE